MKWLLRVLGWKRPERPAELDVTKRRSDAALVKANAALREASRLDRMRASFQRADNRLRG